MKNNKQKRNKNIKKIIILIVAVFVIVSVCKTILIVKEYKSLPTVTETVDGYSVIGVDVSHYQGDIDWPTLASQDLSFAFIKATEGSSHVDSKFEYNWTEAHKTNLKIGAYHFMSFESSGEDQAENFIANVPRTAGMMPPVVDVELYGDFVNTHPSEETVESILKPLLKKLERYYGQKPIIYTSNAVYTQYISGNYDNDIWIADLSMPETLPDGEKWTFLQYTFNGVLDGYSGYLPHLDMNVYRGSKLSFVIKY